MKHIFIAILTLGIMAGASYAQEAVRAEIGEDGVQRVEVVSGSYYFKPSHIIFKVNVPVEMKVRKEGNMVPHNLVIKAPGAGIDLNVKLGKKEKVVRFTPTTAGMYSFYCDKKLLFFKSHRDKGMEGMFEVVE
jgi:plastocyanin domain-containing protein